MGNYWTPNHWSNKIKWAIIPYKLYSKTFCQTLFCQTPRKNILSIRRLWSSRSVKFTAVIEKLVRRYHVQSPKIDLTDTLESWLRNHESWFMTKIFELVVRKTLINIFAGEIFSVSQPNKNLRYKISAQSSIKCSILFRCFAFQNKDFNLSDSIRFHAHTAT